MGKEGSLQGSLGLSDLSGSVYLFTYAGGFTEQIEQIVIPILAQYFPDLKVTKSQAIMGDEYLLTGFARKSKLVYRAIYNVLLSFGWEEAYAPWATGAHHSVDKWLANREGVYISTSPVFPTEIKNTNKFKERFIDMLSQPDPAPATQSSSQLPSLIPSSKPQPIYSPPANAISSPHKERIIALLLEILPGIFGLLGIGWIYSGNTTSGILWMIGVMVWNCGAIIAAVLTGGLGLICSVPINWVFLAISAIFLHRYTKQHPERFGA